MRAAFVAKATHRAIVSLRRACASVCSHTAESDTVQQPQGDVDMATLNLRYAPTAPAVI